MRRSQLLLFALCFITFGWFHQGGGWNQNARFAEVRALVEEGRFAVDDFLVYRNGEGRMLVRPKIEHGEFTYDGVRYQLSWGDWQNVGTAAKPDWQQRTVFDTALDPAATMVVIGEGTCTGDVGIAPDGHFHPNKPPGASLLATPVYFLLYHAERALGYSADDWWVLSVNAWLCSALTVGLVSALGVVLFFRLACAMYPGQTGAALVGALMLGFGTTFFPFATLMFDHNLTAVLLLASFAAVRSDRPMLAGAAAGAAAITNYLAAIPGAFFGLWALCRCFPNVRAAVRFTLGVLPCLVALLAYNFTAFGTPFAVNTSFQNPAFKELTPAFLGMFIAPQWFAAVTLTVSPWRGIFVLCPGLLLGVVGLWQWWRAGTFRAERRIILAIATFFFGVNICFNGFHGGFAAGPRYLIAVMPFLCLPLVGALVRLKERPPICWGKPHLLLFLLLIASYVAVIQLSAPQSPKAPTIDDSEAVVGVFGSFTPVSYYNWAALFALIFVVVAYWSRSGWGSPARLLIYFSILQNTLLTATDALCPLGVGAHAWVNWPGEWKQKIYGNSLVWHYAWPLFKDGKATPVIEDKYFEWLCRSYGKEAYFGGFSGARAEQIDYFKRSLNAKGYSTPTESNKPSLPPAGEIFSTKLQTKGNEDSFSNGPIGQPRMTVDAARDAVDRGEPEPLWIAAMPGPVSVNVMGLWDGTYFQNSPAHSPQANWASFNAGELLFPQSRWSLAPLALLWLLGGAALVRMRVRNVN